ncbi:glutamate receptor ionotropic, delta-1-like [Bemisia tabaci]|uniref:glutamate receptor ionotropic, delta-1-like n=1 Tax=Bemisia tabaci TaxID=7038 RepID=UPI003B283104
MTSSPLIEMFLMTMCTNYPVLNVTTTEPPPWQWVPERKTPKDVKFFCKLKQVPQLRKELLRGKKLRVITIDHWPVSWIQDVNGTMIGRGIAFEILNTLQEKFGFTYEIRLPSSMSLLDEKGTITDMLKNRQADMVAAFVPNLPDLENVLEWGAELCQYEYVILTRRPSESATGSGLLAPFAREVWFFILAAVIFTGPVIWVIMKIRAWMCGPSQVFSLADCVWFVYGALMKQGSTLSPIHDSTRVLFAGWWIFIMILTAFYTANLTAFLTLSKFTLSIHTVDDIAWYGKWMAEKGAAVEYSVQVKKIHRSNWC